MPNPTHTATRSDIVFLILIGLVLLLGAACFVWIIPSYFESRAYTNLTGKHVSTWDAMFLDLRIQEPIK